MNEEELKERRVQVQKVREHIINLVSHANREDATKSIDDLSTLIAMTATDIAIKTTSDTFVKRIKEAAKEGEVIANGKQS